MTATEPRDAFTEPSRGPRLDRRRESGFALIAGLVVLVLLGSIGAAMVRLSSTEQASSSAAILGARADWAARSGLEWAVQNANTTGGCVNGTLTLTESALSGFTVEVSCTETRHHEGSEEIQNLRLESSARFGAVGTPDFVFRQIEATVIL